jgi:hypothetical protein
MEKVLVYHIYLCDDINENIGYKINLECLKYYINIFDKVKFILVMDNIEDTLLRNKGIEYVNKFGFTKETEIVFRKNTEIGEAATVRDYIANLDIDKDSLTFFGHTKGIKHLKGEFEGIRQSVFMWLLIMYFYNFNLLDEVESIFTGNEQVIKPFYGTLLMKVVEREKIQLMVPDYHYSGSFYWVNKSHLNKIKHMLNEDLSFTNRYDAEFFPNFLIKNNTLQSFGSHEGNMLKLDNICGKFYIFSKEDWDITLDILGNKEEFNVFKEYIIEKTGFEIKE